MQRILPLEPSCQASHFRGHAPNPGILAAMTKTLLSWAAKEDIDAIDHPDPNELGPTLRATRDLGVDRVVLLSNTGRPEMARGLRRYQKWLTQETGARVDLVDLHLKDPSDHVAILELATGAVEALQKERPRPDLHFLLSAGTPAMHAVWLLLAKSRFHAALVKCSIESGTKIVELPFEISTDFAADLLERSDERRVRLTQGLPPEFPEFDGIVAGSRPMQEAIAMSRRLAPRNVPVLILGESGTGKELFARAIRAASPRKNGPFLALNCGAIPSELIDSRLFGHAKGAFTGAAKDTHGVFEEASGGTLLLDEVGELPLDAQVRLLRTLQENEVVRVGETQPRPVDVRVIAATHVDLFQAVDDGGFRRDLLYRLAVGIVRLPPLRDRGKDLHALIDTLLNEVQAELFLEPDFQRVSLTRGARSLLARHRWPGNVRELRTTLVRACITATDGRITQQDAQDAILPLIGAARNEIADRPFDDHFDMKALEHELRQRYMDRALEESGGIKSKAADLMNVPPQTFQNWSKE